jgi:hypothetical protein
MRAIPFAARLAAIVTAALVITYIVVLALTGAALRDDLHAQDEAIHRFILTDLQHEIEQELDRGSPLGLLDVTGTLFNHRLSEENTLGIGIIGPDGEIAFDTEAGRAGTPAPPDWRPPEIGTKEWSHRSVTEALVGVALAGPAGKTMGYAVLRYDRTLAGAQVRVALLRLTRNGLAALAAATLAAVAAVTLLGRWHRRRLANVVAALETIAIDPSHGVATAIRDDTRDAPSGFIRAAVRTTGKIEDASRDLLRIGAGEDV